MLLPICSCISSTSKREEPDAGAAQARGRTGLLQHQWQQLPFQEEEEELEELEPLPLDDPPPEPPEDDARSPRPAAGAATPLSGLSDVCVPLSID